MAGVVVFAPLGPNPAALVELLWWLRRGRGLTPEVVHVVVDAEATHYLHAEVLAPGTALDALRDALGLDALGLDVRAGFRAHLVVDAEGRPLTDDAAPEAAAVYRQSVWESALAATDEAGERPVYFGLCGGRRRTMTAMTATAYQWLARAGDHCVDVRVTDRRAEGGSGFFFPEQPWQALRSPSGEPFLARDVGIRVVEVALPRLRGLVPPTHRETYASALAAGQAALDAVALPELRVDVDLGKVEVDGAKLPLSAAELVWVATLALARREGLEWLPVRGSEVFSRVLAAALVSLDDELKHAGLRAIAAGEGSADHTEPLAKLRADVTRKLRDWTAIHGHARWLVPERKRRRKGPEAGAWMRLPLPADRIEVVGVDAQVGVDGVVGS